MPLRTFRKHRELRAACVDLFLSMQLLQNLNSSTQVKSIYFKVASCLSPGRGYPHDSHFPEVQFPYPSNGDTHNGIVCIDLFNVRTKLSQVPGTKKALSACLLSVLQLRSLFPRIKITGAAYMMICRISPSTIGSVNGVNEKGGWSLYDKKKAFTWRCSRNLGGDSWRLKFHILPTTHLLPGLQLPC